MTGQDATGRGMTGQGMTQDGTNPAGATLSGATARGGQTATPPPRDPVVWAAVVALLVGATALAGLIALAGENPLLVLAGLIRYAFFTTNGLADTTVRAIPFCLVGLGVALAFRAGVFNIGADGQLIAGAGAAIACAPLLAGWPAPSGLLVLLLAGMAGGAVWGAIAGILKARFGANEIIATIMLNYIAVQLLGWLLRGPLQEPGGIFPRSVRLAADLRLPVLIDGTRITAGLLVALLAVAAVWIIVARSRWGFALTLTGANPEAARYGGARPGFVVVSVMAASGALAGLAGIVEVSGLHGRLQEGFAPGFGLTAIAVALLARLNPLLIPVSAFGFAGLYVGSATVARTSAVPYPVVHLIEAAIILGFLAVGVLRRRAPAAG
jgi:general nucleoside transport system permease protein